MARVFRGGMIINEALLMECALENLAFWNLDERLGECGFRFCL